MGIEVPEGCPMEQPKSQDEAETNPAEKEKSKPNKKFLLVTAGLVVACVTIGLLVGLVPDWDKNNESVDNATNGDNTDGDNTDGDLKETISYFTSHVGPFDIKVPLFSEHITRGYETEEELEQDIQLLAKFALNNAIDSNIRNGIPDQTESVVVDDSNMSAGVPEAGLDESVGDSLASDGGAATDLSGVTDFTTNNQEDSVDKADFTKSDGVFVFASYGEYLLVWRADSGELTAKIQMPAVTDEPICPEWAYYETGMTVDSTGFADEAMIAPEPYCYTPKPYVEALVIEGTRLGVIVSGYSQAYTSSPTEEPLYIWDYQNTRVQIYDINDGNPLLLTSKDYNGSFRNAYSVNGNIHVVTQASLNVDEHLLQPVQRWQEDFVGMNDEEYLAAATQLSETLVQDFSTGLLEQLQVSGAVDLARLSLFADSVSSDGVAETELYGGSIANAYTQVISFSMTADEMFDSEDFAHIAGILQPGGWGEVYATTGMIIVADQGWTWLEDEQMSGQKTYLTGFRLDGASSTHTAVGSVPGYLLNSYAIDFVIQNEESYIRVATTQNFWRVGFIDPIEVTDPVLMEETSDGDATDTASSVTVDDVSDESSTINQIIVLKIPTSETSLETVGNITLGKPNEVFTALRFFDLFAYAVTAERSDPFYVIDFSIPDDPKAVGELEVSGFSEYLHPINAENTLLLAVGQETDSEGVPLGLQVSLFDASDPTSPELVDRFVVENEGDSSSTTSSVAWDARAFRYLRVDDNNGFVIIPMTIYRWTNMWVDWEEEAQMANATGNATAYETDAADIVAPPNNFEGFSIFAVNDRTISHKFDVDHSVVYDYSSECYGCGWLPERSFVFNGDVMTIKGEKIVSTDLGTNEMEWSIDISDLGLCCSE